MRLLVIASLALALAAAGGGYAAAAFKDDGGGGGSSGTVYYVTVPFAISWTDHYSATYTQGSNYEYVTQQNQGGCEINGADPNRPFRSVVTGDVIYYWYGGNGSPIPAAYGAALCNPYDQPWGSGNTSSSVLFIDSDPLNSDYTYVESHWMSTETFPTDSYEHHFVIWH